MNHIDQLYFKDTKEGEKTIVMLHGVMMSHEIWEKQIAHFSGSYRVIALDMYGMGQSKILDRQNTYEEHAIDLKKILDALKLEKIQLMGWSLGGGVSIKFASLFPQMVEKLVLVGTTPKLIGGDDFEFGMPEEAASGFIQSLEDDYIEGIKGFVDLQLPEANADYARELLLRIVPKTDKALALRQLGSTGSVDLRPDVKKIQSPTLVINGELDNLCSPQAGKYMVDLMSNGRFQKMQGLGHAPFLTSPKAYNTLVDNFLQES